MKVALLTMFNGLDSTYSLVNVVAEQIRMMLNDDVKPIMLVSENCPIDQREGIFRDPRIEWRKVTNQRNGTQIHWKDYSNPEATVHDTFSAEADVVAKSLIQHLSDVDACIMHDIHYQGWHLLHNVAVRKAQKSLPHIRFLAFTHSAPANRPQHVEWPLSARYTSMPNTKYIYPTKSGLPALAKQYNVSLNDCFAVNNSLDLMNYASEEVRSLSRDIDLLSPDYLVIYPGRLTTGKKFEKVASLCGAIKKTKGDHIQVIFCDFPSADIDSETYKSFIRFEGETHGLDKKDICFTSDLEPFKNGFPRRGVLELFTFSNLFICPSYSESFGLTVLEAASKGNFLVLNERVPALEELGQNLNAYFMKWDARNFGFDTHEEYHPSEEAYLQEHAQNISHLMRENVVLNAKTIARNRYSPDWVWRNQLKPLLNS
ncbi:glycosyltransferase [Aquisalibacillus elongatus]|uniref:Glycosyl transferase family 1 n=1 Tax=Aquisalibacillus elongatus TaxID=485577 RepID=A0A3N5BLY2_9BACI|nr:glycosyltransferase [Aquisalibacillus elongatus]RPF50698.1 glycosyl transferase family 1 [Aquisalibacillus elongatus]